jgi:non-canonical poly(A) RNA polymerase PAPD5/7
VKNIPKHLSFPRIEVVVFDIFQQFQVQQCKETYMGGLGSYLLVCVVLSFLQLHPSAQFARAHSVSTLGKLLLDFFRYYGQDITCL